MKPLLIAHRGDTVNHKENTIEGFESAFNLGADGIELDTQLSDSEQVIVVHNYQDSFKDGEFPPLSEVLEKFGDKGRLEIELKSPNIESAYKVAQLIKQYNPPDFEITSFHMPHLARMRELLPDSKIGLIFNTVLLGGDWATEKYCGQLMLAYLNLSGANYIHLPIAFLNQHYVDLFHEKGIKVHGDLGDNTDQYAKAVELGVDQCTLNDVPAIKNLKG